MDNDESFQLELRRDPVVLEMKMQKFAANELRNHLIEQQKNLWHSFQTKFKEKAEGLGDHLKEILNLHS
jgi:hypothetical protein